MTPKQLVHRGTITAAALLFDTAVLGEDEAQRRILALWEPGVRVSQTEDGALLVILARPKALIAERAPGLPLVRERGHLLGLPLTKAACEALAPPPESLIFAERGRVVVVALAELTPVEPADWLALDTLTVIPTQPLVPPPPVVTTAILEALPPLKATPLVTPNPALTAQKSSLLDALNQPPSQTPRPRRRLEDLSPLEQARWRLTWWFRDLRKSVSNATTDRLRETIREQVFAPGQLEAISRQNAEYLSQMLALFEQGKWHEALQHAIPLGKPGENDDTPTGIGVLRPRSELAIRPTPTRADSSLPWTGLHDGFKQLYREAVERLKNEGRFDEAAYVLAELLREDEEAVSFLERHGQLRLAAELAEARKLPPSLIVRQWWLAGEKERAIALARRHQCFSEVIFRLEQSSQRAAAETLRVEWAQLHAEWGDYARAVATVDPVEAARPLAKRWAELGATQGGVGGAQLLARLLLWSESAEESEPWQEQARALLKAPGAARERETLLTVLFTRTTQPAAPALLPLLRLGLRAALADHGSGSVTLPANTATTWTRKAQLPALEADLPSLTPKPPTPLLDRTEPLEIRIEGGDTGNVPIVDAAALPDGRTLVALGEAGVLLLSHGGRILHRFELPATSLVVGRTGARAVALAHRDESQRVHVLDLGTRKVTDWGELSLLCWESELHDGLWRVARNGQLLELDTLAPQPRALTTIETGDPVLALGPDRSVLSLSTQTSEPFLWNDARPTMRRALPFQGGTFDFFHDSFFWLETESDAMSLFGDEVVVLHAQVGALERSCVLGEPGDTPVGLAVVSLGRAALTLSALRDPLGITVLGTHSVAGDFKVPQLQLRLSGAERVRLRATPDALTVADSQGRLLVIHPTTGQLVRDLRVRL